MDKYDHQLIENKWVGIWDKLLASGESNWLFSGEEALVKANDDAKSAGVPGSNKKYLLDMFPYPSGSGLHVGHVEEKVAIDIYARFLRMKGENVLMPTGYDSFGLPTENYAIKNEISPAEATEINTNNFHEQTKKIGISYDWTREFATSDPDYYKFTQWWFKFLHDRGIAYKKKQAVNWCPSCQTVLANEQVIDGFCERCDTEVVQKEMTQWFFAITKYAERLLNDLGKLDWPESTKAGQRNWIGRSEGIDITYLVPRYQKVLIGTSNSEKLKRIRRYIELNKLPIEIVTPEDEGITVEVVEDGDNKYENALKKALAYSEHTDLPVMSLDSGLESDEVEFHFETKEIALQNYSKANGRTSEFEFSKEEIADAILIYYKELARKLGGGFDAEFVDEYVLVQKGQLLNHEIGRRPISIYSKGSEKINYSVPLNSIYKPKLEFAGKRVYGSELSDEQNDAFIAPAFEALKKLLTYEITVFTTRPDTNFGATFVALAPDGEFCKNYAAEFPNKEEVAAYIKSALAKTERERQEDKEKTGVDTGLVAINQLTGKQMPIYVSDFVLGSVGTGALVGVPGHDKRDFEFAQKFDLEIIRVVIGEDGDESKIERIEQVQEDAGTMVGSGFLDGMEIMEAKEKIMDHLEEKGWGKRVVNYKLRDWSVSRQRYWGSPIPVVYRNLSAEDKARQETFQQQPAGVLNLHAISSSPDEAYHPWLDRELGELGVNADTPVLPHAEQPNPAEWMDTAFTAYERLMAGATEGKDKTGIQQENIVVTGRSLGAWTALQLAEKKKFRKLVLVCPVNPAYFELLSAGKILKEVSSSNPEFVETTRNFVEGNPVDLAKVSENVSEIVVYLSQDDRYIPFAESKEYFQENLANARIVSFRESGHFSANPDPGAGTGVKDSAITAAEEVYLQSLRAEILAPVRLDIELVPDQQLPVVLPTDVDYRPQGTAPLGTSQTFDADLEQLGYPEGSSREIDTMDTFVCSSWYFFRFLDPHNSEKFAASEKLRNFGPVDFYIGGAEHTVLHLLYARFFTKVAYDAGLIDYDEPFLKLRHQGMIMGPDGRKMSKRWGNIINPNDIVEEYGADTLRMYEMFMGPLDQSKAWNEGGVKGIRRFLVKVWDMSQKLLAIQKESSTAGLKAPEPKVRAAANELRVKIASDIEKLKFNTAISEFMKFTNLVQPLMDKADVRAEWLTFIRLLNPFAPFITSELAEKFEMEGLDSTWPEALPELEQEQEDITIVVMVNGKLRQSLELPAGSTQDHVEETAFADEKVQKYATRDTVKKVIFVPDKLINIVC